MANYYTDHPEIGFHLNHPLMRRVAELKERGYSEKEKYHVSSSPLFGAPPAVCSCRKSLPCL